jgi:hypothetical protein
LFSRRLLKETAELSGSVETAPPTAAVRNRSIGAENAAAGLKEGT